MKQNWREPAGKNGSRTVSDPIRDDSRRIREGRDALPSARQRFPLPYVPTSGLVGLGGWHGSKEGNLAYSVACHLCTLVVYAKEASVGPLGVTQRPRGGPYRRYKSLARLPPPKNQFGATDNNRQ